MIAFLGMGLLGANFVRALRRRGESVQVWNRSAAKARALAETGAVVRDTPADTVRGARLVHLTLSDDAVVDDVLERARPGLSRPPRRAGRSSARSAGARAESRSSTRRCSWGRRTRSSRAA